MTTSQRISTITRVIKHRQRGIIVLEDIHDPHNAGAILRSVDAFGFQHVYFIFEKEKAYNPRRIGKQSSASANKWLTIRSFSRASDCYDTLKQAGVKIYATTLEAPHPCNLYETLPTLGPQIALVFGNEHTGISDTAKHSADYHLYIPMRGFVQSLNVSVSVALVLAEFTRRREEQGIGQFLATSHEQNELRTQWVG